MRKAALSAIESLVEKDDRVVFIGSDLGAGTMSELRGRYPSRVLMEGIAEQHIVTFAAGLALEGFIPYVHTIATFLTRRALEQIVVDVALQGLPVRLLGAGGGMVYAPLGPTHQAIDDFALMRAIPGMSVIAPADPLEMKATLTLLLENLTPAYIRIGKGGEPDITSSLPDLVFGKMRPVRRGEDLAIVTTGALLHECVTAVDRLRGDGIKVSLAHFPFVAPLDDEGLLLLARGHSEILVVEEHLPHGGLATAISDTLSLHNVHTRVHRSSLPNAYADRYGSQSEHLQLHSLDSAGVEAKVRGIRDSYNK